jgi:hypothetical protein
MHEIQKKLTKLVQIEAWSEIFLYEKLTIYVA